MLFTTSDSLIGTRLKVKAKISDFQVVINAVPVKYHKLPPAWDIHTDKFCNKFISRKTTISTVPFKNRLF